MISLHLYKYFMNNKLEHFKKRNRKRNAHLYLDEKIEGTDYIFCPVSKERLSMIKSSYIERVLGMSIEEYDRLYPGVRGGTLRRSQNIRKAIHTVDSVIGKTRYQISQEKSRKILSMPDKNGVTGYKKKGQKTRATHMNNIDEHGRTGYQQQAAARLATILPNGLTVEENAHIKQRETMIKNRVGGTGGASKQSKRVLKPITEFLDQRGIKYYFDNSEYGIKDTDTGNYYFWDLTITDFKIAIEYQSSAWHAYPFISESEWLS
jgi:hypothetical protein